MHYDMKIYTIYDIYIHTYIMCENGVIVRLRRKKNRFRVWSFNEVTFIYLIYGTALKIIFAVTHIAYFYQT